MAAATVFHILSLFTFIDRQENNRVSLSKTQLNFGSYGIGHTTVIPAATSLTLSLREIALL